MAAKGRKFEEELNELENIAAQLDAGELGLEDAVAVFERGVALVRSLNHRLHEIERKVEVLTKNAQGELESAPLEPAENDAGASGGQGGDPGDEGKSS